MDNEDKLLIQEYCYIRTKQEHKAPDVKKAWDQFEHEHIMKKQSLKTKRHVMFLRYAAAIAIILVMVMGGAIHEKEGSSSCCSYIPREFRRV